MTGVWSRTGAATAFAHLVSRKFVTGPKSAKFSAWFLGVLFFQGGTISTVLVGSTIKPVADEHQVSHEELSYIVDSTASPIAALIAFNAWPGYIQSFLYVSGVPFLATESARLNFFFTSIPLSFYSIFAVFFTLLFSFDIKVMNGKKMKKAIERSRQTGELNAPGSEPLSMSGFDHPILPNDYKSSAMDFIMPLAIIIAVCIITFILNGVPEVRIAFGLALVAALFIALFKGIPLTDLMNGVLDGIRAVVPGGVILVAAITIGLISQEIGGGVFSGFADE